jgi:phage terminase large subunit-like protein
VTAPRFTADELKEAASLIGFDQALEAWKVRRPSDWYEPSRPGQRSVDGRLLGWTANQLAFHKAPHPVRALFPGNGWGKTTALGAEVNAWGIHSNQWQETPATPVLMLWFTKLYDQFEMILTQLRADVFGSDVRYSEGDGFTWPDGSRMLVGSADRPRDWHKWQGVPVDLVVFDEEPPLSLWREMMQRRRVRKTRFILGATATESGSWMESDIYAPWLQHHQAQGLDLEGSARAQNHPEYFVWPRGGLHDNRAADAADILWYESRTWSSAKEREVRLFGGFQNWVGDPVFGDAGLEKLRARCRVLTRESPPPVSGMFELDPKVEPRQSAPPDPARASLFGRPVTELTPLEMRGGRFILGPADTKGLVRIYVPPSIGQTAVIGADFAYGLEGRDLDTAIVLDKSVTPARYLATAAGRWGETFDRVLYALAVFYGGAFILGERQVGLPSLRRLLAEFQYTYLYYGRQEQDRRRPVTDKLGHPRTYDDVTLRNLRRAVIDETLEVRDDSVIDQMGRLKYHNPTEITQGQRLEDFRLKIKLSGGGSPDLVMALCYAWHALSEVHHFEKPEPLFPPGSMGEALGYEKLFTEEARPIVGIPLARRPRRR